MHIAGVSPSPTSVGRRRPEDLLQLAGHPLRWHLLSELARSDRTVHELTELVGEAQNLVSYHLRKLREAGLVTSRRSSADGRDAYYSTDLTRFGDLLSSTAAALHPGLRFTVDRTSDVAPDRVRVLFLCTGNSARSQIAEALIRERSGGAVDACSAGSHPKPLHPNAIRVLRDVLEVDPEAHVPKRVDDLAGERFDWVITLCDKVREVCPELHGDPQTIHWSIADPSALTDDDAGWTAFQDLTAELETRIGFLLAVVTSPPPAA
jgi:protein-tyrosine-phosphatase